MSTRTWTRAERQLLFEAVVERFGPYETWRKVNTPGGGRDDEFWEFCGTFAELVGAETANAVHQQLRFAMPTPGGEARWENGRAYDAILNMAAAYAAGFIGVNDVPDLAAKWRLNHREVA